MSLELILVLVFVVTTLIGYKLIKNVPSLLHTPLMSGMNALSGITILATMTATAAAITTGSKIFGCIGIICATINVVAVAITAIFRRHLYDCDARQNKRRIDWLFFDFLLTINLLFVVFCNLNSYVLSSE